MKLGRSIFFLALGLAWPTSADTLAVLGVEAVGAPEKVATQITDALRQRAATEPEITLVFSKEFKEMKMLYNCTNPAELAICLAPVGSSLGADKLLVGVVSSRGRRAGLRYHVALHVVDVHGGTLARSLTDEVTTGGLQGHVGRWFTTLFPRLKAKLVINSEPVDAEILVDGKTRGRTPATVQVGGGASHTVQLLKEGFERATRAVDTKPGDEVVVDVRLKAVAPSPVTPPPPPAERPIAAAPPPPPAPLATSPEALPPVERSGPNAAQITGVALLFSAAVAAGIAVYTWRRYVDLQSSAQTWLADFQADLERANVVYTGTFFTRPTCARDSGLTYSTKNSDNYFATCSEGALFANLTTGLWIGAGVLTAGAITAIVLGHRRAHPKMAFGPPRPRWHSVTPAIDRSGFGLSARFDF